MVFRGPRRQEPRKDPEGTGSYGEDIADAHGGQTSFNWFSSRTCDVALDGHRSAEARKDCRFSSVALCNETETHLSGMRLNFSSPSALLTSIRALKLDGCILKSGISTPHPLASKAVD